jgi:hypothetical protein
LIRKSSWQAAQVLPVAAKVERISLASEAVSAAVASCTLFSASASLSLRNASQSSQIADEASLGESVEPSGNNDGTIAAWFATARAEAAASAASKGRAPLIISPITFMPLPISFIISMRSLTTPVAPE